VDEEVSDPLADTALGDSLSQYTIVRKVMWLDPILKRIFIQDLDCYGDSSLRVSVHVIPLTPHSDANAAAADRGWILTISLK
jgi:hypothetical protein